MSNQKNNIDFDPYKVLQLQSGCSSAQINKAYKQLALKWHPDKNPDQKERAQQMFLKIYRAFEFLKDEVARGDYDDKIETKRRRTEFEKARQATSSKERLLHLKKLQEVSFNIKLFYDLITQKISQAEKKVAVAKAGEKRKSDANDFLIEELRREGAKMMQQMKDDHEKQQRQESRLLSGQLRQKQKGHQNNLSNELSNDVDELERALFGGNVI